MKSVVIKNGKIVSGDTKKHSPVVYWGVCTPKGEADHSISKYFIERQVKQLPPLVTGKPVFINHIREVDGKPTEPVGRVLSSHFIPKTGEIVSFFTLAPSLQGELARTFLGENGILTEEFRMNGLSLGMKIKQSNDELQIPIGHAVEELSICYDPARPGCFLKGKCPLSFFTPEDGKDLNEHINQIINQINNNPLKEVTKEKEKMNTLPDVPVENIPPPSAFQGSLLSDIYNKRTVQQQPTMVQQATASNSTLAIQQEPVNINELQQTIDQLKQQLTGSKRTIEEATEAPVPAIQLNIKQHIPNCQSYPELVLPVDCTEEVATRLRAEHEEKKALWEQVQQYKIKEFQQRAERLQLATQEYIPTLIGEIMQRGGEWNQEAYEKYCAGAVMVGGEEYTSMLSVAEATASASKKNRTNINKLVEDDKNQNQELKTKLEELNKKILELQNQQKPLFHNPKPIQQQQQQFTQAFQPNPPSYIDKMQGAFYQIATATASRLNDKTPYQDAKANSQQMDFIANTLQQVFQEHQHPNINGASNRDMFGGVLEAASKIPGSKARDSLKLKPQWQTNL